MSIAKYFEKKIIRAFKGNENNDDIGSLKVLIMQLTILIPYSPIKYFHSFERIQIFQTYF